MQMGAQSINPTDPHLTHFELKKDDQMVLFNPVIKSGPDYELFIQASELYMVYGRDDNVAKKLIDIRSNLSLSAEELKNLGNYCMKL